MKILSIDTSSNICAVAVLEDTELLKEKSQNNGLTHSVNLMPMIKDLLSELNISLNEIDLIVCDIGPGSFTGIRIGVATAKAFADSLNINSIGISSLEALSYNLIKKDFNKSQIVCSLIDAKNDNVYCSIFENANGNYILRRDFSFENIDNLLNELKSIEFPITFVGDGAINYKEKISFNLPNSSFSNNNNLSAYNLGLAGLSRFLNNEKIDLLPLYLRKPQAEKSLEDKEKGEKNGN